MDRGALAGRPARVAAPYLEPRVPEGPGPEAASGGEFERPEMGLVQQDVGGVNAQVVYRLLAYDVQGNGGVQAPDDRPVDGAQGLEPLQLMGDQLFGGLPLGDVLFAFDHMGDVPAVVEDGVTAELVTPGLSVLIVMEMLHHNGFFRLLHPLQRTQRLRAVAGLVLVVRQVMAGLAFREVPGTGRRVRHLYRVIIGVYDIEGVGDGLHHGREEPVLPLDLRLGKIEVARAVLYHLFEDLDLPALPFELSRKRLARHLEVTPLAAKVSSNSHAGAPSSMHLFCAYSMGEP